MLCSFVESVQDSMLFYSDQNGSVRPIQSQIRDCILLLITVKRWCSMAWWAVAWLHPEAAALPAATYTAGHSAVGSRWFHSFRITILFLTALFLWARYCSINNKTPLNCIWKPTAFYKDCLFPWLMKLFFSTLSLNHLSAVCFPSLNQSCQCKMQKF